MLSSTISYLLDLNRQFYQTFGPAFAATRRRVQPGILGLLDRLPMQANWLDLGCGSGELARVLARRGFDGTYLGVDFSPSLLAEAGGQTLPPNLSFRAGDLSTPGWADGLAAESFDRVTAFAVLHHLPGTELRREVLSQAHRLLRPEGQFIHSEWQFQHSPRLWARRQPWEKIGLRLEDVDEGDTLLDWRAALPGQPERSGLRYVHLFTLTELAALAVETGFEIVEEFSSDGEGGRLGYYQVWKKR